MKVKDWISVIEAGYSLEGNDDSWVNEVLDAASPIIRGWWPNCFVFHYTPKTFHVEEVAAPGLSAIIKKAMGRCETLPADVIDSGRYESSSPNQADCPDRASNIPFPQRP